MACPNFKNRPKNGLGPLGVNHELKIMISIIQLANITACHQYLTEYMIHFCKLAMAISQGGHTWGYKT
jgi:hypothetical protein